MHKTDVSGDMTGYVVELAEKIREKVDINKNQPTKSKSSQIVFVIDGEKNK